MPKNKDGRARRTVKACVICHKKKIRCDIDEIEGDICTPCQRDAYECVPRERKRKRFTFSPSPPAENRFRKAPAKSTVLQESSSLNETVDSNEIGTREGIDHSLGLSTDVISHDHSLESQDELERRRSTGGIRKNPLQESVSDPAGPIKDLRTPSGMSESSIPTSKNVSYLGRLEYLRGEVPVNEDAGVREKVPHRLTKTDIETLRLQRVADLPPRAVRETLLDAFWTRCDPWTPVVERSWVYDRRPGKVSLLLQHAIFLAGSRVSAPLARYPSEDFYKKARILFWMGVEEDPIITIAAACLLHWWNPQGPEEISLDTSSFWLRVCVGLAHQVGLHREPIGKTDSGLRKRIWWSLVVRDSLINAGHGRPRAIDLKLADVTPISASDFEELAPTTDLFASYVGISCILGDLTQSYLRKQGLQEHRKSLEDRLFRWIKTLPDHFQLCRQTEGRPLNPYSFEGRQLHVQYFIVLIILNRPADPSPNPSTASLLASSYVAGIFEDFMARDELRYLGPIFTFYCLTAGMTHLSCYRYSDMVHLAEESLGVMARALEELSKRWPTAIGSLKHLMDVRKKVIERPHLGQSPDINFPHTTAQFFSDFGPDLCRMWNPIHRRLPQNASGVLNDLEMTGTLQGFNTPNNQALDLDITNTAIQNQIPDHHTASGALLEPTLLQPQEWFGPYNLGNWLTVDWEQGLGW